MDWRKPKINDPYGTQGGSGGSKKESESDRKKRLKHEWEAAQGQQKAGHRKKAQKIVDDNRNRRITTYSPAGTKNLPFGVKLEEIRGPHGEKEYKMVVDEDQINGIHPGDKAF